MRKVLSRCSSYQHDYALQGLLYDIALARQLTTVVNMAESKKMAPDNLVSSMQNFGSFWMQETQKLEDMTRQMGRLPNLFFTIAPAEWSFPLHCGTFVDQYL